jgi:hypothetical protein
MKTLGRKMMIILASALFGFLGLWFLLATCLTIPGQGLESLKFIKSVEKQIDRVIPEGKFVLKYDPTKSCVSPTVQKLLMSFLWRWSLLNFKYWGCLTIKLIKNKKMALKLKNILTLLPEHFDKKWGDILEPMVVTLTLTQLDMT